MQKEADRPRINLSPAQMTSQLHSFAPAHNSQFRQQKSKHFKELPELLGSQRLSFSCAAICHQSPSRLTRGADSGWLLGSITP